MPPCAGLSDALLHLAQNRDQASWALLVEWCGPATGRLALRLCGRADLAQDAVQEAWLQIRDGAGAYAPRGPDPDAGAWGWIMRVTANAVLQWLRRERRRAADPLAAEPPAATQPTEPELADALRAALITLPEDQRSAVVLRHVEGLDIPAIAAALGCSADAAKKRVQRGLDALRLRLAACPAAALPILLADLPTPPGGVPLPPADLLTSAAAPACGSAPAALGMTMATKLALAATIPLTLAGSLWVALPAADPPAADPPPVVAGEARFRVGTQVVNPGVEAFTATTDRIGNSFLRTGGCGFEPVQLRNKFTAAADGENSIAVEKTPLTGYDSHREGIYDGAEVLVFRIVEGKFRLVRRDRVAPGGHKASGWSNKIGGDQLIAPTTATYTGGLETWSRPEVPYWFTLVSIDKQGRQGPHAAVVRFERTANPVKAAKGEEDGLLTLPRQRGRNAATTEVEGSGPPAPTGLAVATDDATGQPRFTWTPSSDPAVAGYRLLRSDTDPASHAGYRLDLAGKAAHVDERIRAGDMVIVRKELLTTSRRTHLSNRIYDAKANREFLPEGIEFHADEDPALSWALEPHAADSPVTGGGQTAARFEIRDGREFAIAPYAYGPSSLHWWPTFMPDRDYTVEFWAKADKPLTATFNLTGFYEPKGRNPVAPATFAITGGWQRFTHTFRVPVLYQDAKGAIGGYKLSVTGPATLWLDNLRIIEAGTPYAALTPDDLRMFSEAHVSAIRTHAFIKTGTSSYSMAQLLAPAGAINATRGNTVPQTLAIMEQVKARPWLQIEMHMAPEEWLGLVEYLAAPYDPAVDTPASKPWAARRHAQGRSKPWSDAFDRIYLELSNETWNGLFRPWTFENMKDAATGAELDRGTVYGLFQEWFIDQLATSPWWKQAGLDRKVEFVIGGWATQTKPDGYGQKAIAASPRSRHLTIAAYNGGWDEGEGPMTQTDASLQRILLFAAQVGSTRSRDFSAYLASEKNAGRGSYVNGVYEAGPGYALSGLNNQAQMSPDEVEGQARAMKSLASGTATLDSFLEKAAQGFVLNNFFTLARGRTHWVSHSELKNGGHPHLPFATIQLFNREGTGDLLQVEVLDAPRMSMPAFKRRPAGKDMPLAMAYATRTGDRVNLFVLSRRLDKHPDPASDGFTPTTIELPFSSAGKVTLHRLAGDPRAHNLDAESVRIATTRLPATILAPREGGSTLRIDAASGVDARGLPPAATLLYVFEGTK